MQASCGQSSWQAWHGASSQREVAHGPVPGGRGQAGLRAQGVLVVIGVLLVTGLWDSLLSQLRVWAGSVNLPL
jgi:hypothetical protein